MIYLAYSFFYPLHIIRKNHFFEGGGAINVLPSSNSATNLSMLEKRIKKAFRTAAALCQDDLSDNTRSCFINPVNNME